MGHGEAVNQRRPGRSWECLQAEMAGEEEPCSYLGALALSVDSGIIGRRREEERESLLCGKRR